jgi:hypothetical protein
MACRPPVEAWIKFCEIKINIFLILVPEWKVFFVQTRRTKRESNWFLNLRQVEIAVVTIEHGQIIYFFSLQPSFFTWLMRMIKQKAQSNIRQANPVFMTI